MVANASDIIRLLGMAGGCGCVCKLSIFMNKRKCWSFNKVKAK